MFGVRLRSGIILVILAIALIMSGGPILCAGLGIISLIGIFELYRVFHIEKKSLGIVGYLMCILYYMYLYFRPGNNLGILLLLIVSVIILLAVYVFAFPAYHANQVLAAFFGIIYVGVMLSYVYQTRLFDKGILVWLVFLSSWGCDTCAYCVGMLCGKHKMAPVLSPKKTIEGGVGGVVGAILLGMLFGYFLVDAKILPNPVISCAIVCGIGALISMIGDLAASAIKRNYEVKDYGTLIPGHGGILDRFDSVIFTAPVIYYTILLLMKGLSIL